MDFIEILRHQKIEQSWVAIGAFDGVHRGHQALFDRLVTGAHRSGCTAVAITFDPLPAVFFKRVKAGNALSTIAERVNLIKACGVDEVFVLPFTQALADIDALSFMQGLRESVGIRHLLAGFNFTLGKDRDGTVARLTEIGREIGYEVEVVHPVKDDGEIISSSNIRRLLQGGEIAKANRFLGRPYAVAGQVVHGEHRGSKLGFPTANVAVPAERLLPAMGVYACRAFVDGKAYLAVTNVGVRPTFDSPLPAPRVEPYLLDTSEQFYDKYLSLEFHEYLRPEQKFPDSQALIAQITQDVEKTRGLLTG